MADLEHGLTIHELELTETISGDFFVAVDDGTNTKKAKVANLNSASATSAQTYAQEAAASAAASASSATQAQTSAQSIQSAMVQATSQLQGYVDDAAASASNAAASEANIRGLITSDYAKLARSYATGDSGYREGEETDNAKYYSEQSESYVDDAAAQAVIAGQKAGLAEDHAEESEDHALESEGHALGTQNGTPVSSDSPYYHNNAKYWADEARQSSAGGVAASVIATAEPTNISSHAYAIGDQFVYNGILYTATSAISVGDTIAPGTNCSISDTITEQIGNAGKVTGVKGNAESTYRTGNVNISPANIGYFSGSTLSIGGSVPPSGGAGNKFLCADGTWKEVEGGGTTIVQIPSVVIETYTYDGTEQAPTITGLDATNTVITGVIKSTDAGNFTFTIALKDKSKMVWSDMTNVDRTYTWSIAKAACPTTVSANSVILDASHLSATVTLSDVTGVVTVSSSDTSIATVSESSGVITISSVNDTSGSPTITVDIATSTNYLAGTLTINVSAQFNFVGTLYSAANDTVTFTDALGTHTVVTDSTGKAKNVTISGQSLPGTITFSSSVADNPSNISQRYSKSIYVDATMTEIYVMPDGEVVFWYGYEPTTPTVLTPTNDDGWGDPFVACTTTKNTNTRTCTNKGQFQGIAYSIPHTNYTKTHIIASFSGGQDNYTSCGIALAEGITKTSECRNDNPINTWAGITPNQPNIPKTYAHKTFSEIEVSYVWQWSFNDVGSPGGNGYQTLYAAWVE